MVLVIDKIMSAQTSVKTTIKPFVKPFFIVFTIYFVAMLSILRSGFSFGDDMGRAITGLGWTRDFNRYSQSWLMYILNVDFTLTDISPLPQIVAMAFLAVTSVIVTYLFCGNKINYLPLVLSTFIGLSPFIIMNWLYKFDSPGMAMSLMVSVIPFLFWHPLREWRNVKAFAAFGIVSTVCLMVMLTSYQASSGIYFVMMMGMMLCDFIEKRKIKQTIKNSAIFSIPYLAAVLIFRFALPYPDGYRDTEMLIFSDIVPGIMYNIRLKLAFLNAYSSHKWRVFFFAVLISYAISLLVFSKRKGAQKLVDVAVGSAFVIASIPMSYGLFLLLQNPFISARSNMGIGLIMALVGIITARNRKQPSSQSLDVKLPSEKTAVSASRFSGITNALSMLLAFFAVLTLYSSIVFSFAIGNALADQNRWNTFRLEMLLADLAHLYPSREATGNDALTVQLVGNVGLSVVAYHVNRQYPITQHILLHPFGGESYWENYKFRYYYGRYLNLRPAWGGYPWDCSFWQIKLETYYHVIRDDGDGRVSVVLR